MPPPSDVWTCGRLQVVLILVITCLIAKVANGTHNFREEFEVVWGKRNARFMDKGRWLELSLDEEIGSRIESKNLYMFGRFDLEIKLMKGESAGTITSFYICTGGMYHDEVDFEFLGNVTGEPYTVHTNFFVNGTGEKEQQFTLWFDPTEDFHTYSILWNPLNIILYVDGTPIRVYKNNEMYGLPFPTRKPVKVYASIWDAEEWATQGGRVKTDWAQAPFVAQYRSFDFNSTCVRQKGVKLDCGNPAWMSQKLDWWSWMSLNWVQMNYMVYDYCTDHKRFHNGLAPECTVPTGKY